MKKLLMLAMVPLMCMMGEAVHAQEIKNGPLTVVTGGDFTTSSGSSVFSTALKTLTNTTKDSVRVKVTGGTNSNVLRFWTVGLKVSGATDSITIKIWGTAEAGTGTHWDLLYTDNMSNTSTPQVFNRLVNNNYTNYKIVYERVGLLPQVSTYKFSIYFK